MLTDTVYQTEECNVRCHCDWSALCRLTYGDAISTQGVPRAAGRPGHFPQ